jgi:hypothetical protein
VQSVLFSCSNQVEADLDNLKILLLLLQCAHCNSVSYSTPGSGGGQSLISLRMIVFKQGCKGRK